MDPLGWLASVLQLSLCISNSFSVGGPYIISCGNHSDMVIYLTVNDKTKEVAVTFDKKDAKPFSVKTVNETLHRHELEFSLTSTLGKIKPLFQGGQVDYFRHHHRHQPPTAIRFPLSTCLRFPSTLSLVRVEVCQLCDSPRITNGRGFC